MEPITTIRPNGSEALPLIGDYAMDLVGFLYGFGLLQGLLLATVLIFAGSGQRQANGFMAGLVVAIALSLLQNWLIRSGYFFENPSLGLIIPPLDFIWGPLLYLYAYRLTNRSASWSQLLHFVPALYLLSYSLSFTALPTEDQRNTLLYLWSQHNDPELQQQVSLTIAPSLKMWIDYHLQGNLFSLQLGIYCFLVLAQIRHHNRRMQQHFSSLETLNLRWLQKLALACLVFLGVFLAFNRSQLILVGHFDVNALLPSIPYLFLVFLVYGAGIAAFFQPNLIRGVSAAMGSELNTPQPRDPQPTPAEPIADEIELPSIEIQDNKAQPKETAKSTKYERSGLSLQDAEDYKVRLMQKMQQEELYLDCELTLPDLARETGLTPHQVSQVLNGQMNQNFFSFVNNYRIQLAKALLSDPKTQNTPIVELAVEVGFKSKSSFYDAFNKATQMTPTQFKKRQH